MPAPDPDETAVYTVGHSTHDLERFLALVQTAGIDAIADVRSSPYSRRCPQYDRPALKRALEDAGIRYVFLGEALGARPDDRTCYRDGIAEYDRIAATERFRSGLQRVVDGARRYRIALLCAEKEPLDCHRTILVSRHLSARGVKIRHVLADGRIEDHADTERRLLRITNLSNGDLFAEASERADPMETAYRRRGSQIAYREEERTLNPEDCAAAE